MTDIRDFEVRVAQEDLDDLKRRLAATRFPEAEVVDDWSQGTPLEYMKEICDYWRDEYDGTRIQKRLAKYDGYVTELDGLDIHFLHVKSSNADALPLAVTHGWPGSVVEFLKVIDPLVEPQDHGGDAADAFHLVVPTLPGFGYSGKPTKPGWSIEKIASEWDELMVRLGYHGYVAQGGDWGAIVTTAIGAQAKGHCRGIHVNMAIVRPDPSTMGDLTDSEQSALEGMKYYQDWDSGYSKQQSTRPQTVGYGLVDSPIGQAAWILEKFWAWVDHNGHPEDVLTRDELLDNVMMYWLTSSGASSARIYWESFGSPNLDPVEIPAGYSLFPKEIFRASKRWVEQRFKKLVYFNELEEGGHFAAFERPETYVDEVRKSFRPMR